MAAMPNTNMILSDFAFNVKLDESLFSVVPPRLHDTDHAHQRRSGNGED